MQPANDDQHADFRSAGFRLLRIFAWVRSEATGWRSTVRSKCKGLSTSGKCWCCLTMTANTTATAASLKNVGKRYEKTPAYQPSDQASRPALDYRRVRRSDLGKARYCSTPPPVITSISNAPSGARRGRKAQPDGPRRGDRDCHNSLFQFLRRFRHIPHDHQTQFRHVLNRVFHAFPAQPGILDAAIRHVINAK